MGDVLKLLLLFCIVTAVAGSAFPRKNKCPEGQYKFKNACFQCTPCGDFMYEQEKCSKTSNTVCGWCGKKPNLDNLSHEILASYQTKCLMSSLEFIGMTKLKDEMINVFNDDTEKFSSRDTIINGENLEVIDAEEDRFKIAKESLNGFEDSEEQELPDPTYEEGKDSDSAENEESRKVDPSVKVVKLDKEEDFDDQMEDLEETDAEYKTRLEYEQENEDLFGSLYSDYYKKKSAREEDQKRKVESVYPSWVRKYDMSHEVVVKVLKDLGPKQPILPHPRHSFSSSEESNEREIKWDNWVDDEVKILGKNVEIVEAEEISSDDNEKYDAYEKKPMKRLTDIEKRDIISRLTEKFSADHELEYPARPPPPFFSPVMFACMGFVIMSSFMTFGYIQLRQNNVFNGVPTDAEDYQMIIDASKRIEELEKKEKQANRHVHINPVFDV
ncbi:hypothetical protein GCK72_023868 [Caenorhabditis remanei]|uniref:TNFR-Cys domain-containing protein n=1 Tax=Caenorhabditis remanei TaxID=31234 RepID=A0A6A5FXR7_CAERE|nr:hypothetical protein GCK72_023868 [Caenorhabditis remanei]KAF1747406.1 hypothetical protein GCK72_023868 [Caenorhabditis remanei]